MKKVFWIGLVILILGLAAGLAIPVFAGEPQGEAVSPDQKAWEDMHQACANGDWAAMNRAAEEVHGKDFANACHGDDQNNGGNTGSGGGWGGMMGNGMMGNGMMGSW